MRKGKLLYHELFGLIIFLILLLLLVPLVSYLMSSGVTSATEKGFSVLSQRISQVSSASDTYMKGTSVDITLGEEYALYGFDANYTGTIFLSRINNLRARDSQGAYSMVDDVKLPKPGGCHGDRACLCLAKDCEPWQDDFPSCITWVQCTSFGTDMVLAGVPYYDEDLHASPLHLNGIEEAYRDVGVWSGMNFGLPHEGSAFHESFREQGMNRSWSDWYGYLYVPGTVTYTTGSPATVRDTGGVHGTGLEGRRTREGGTMGFYIEKFDDGETTYVLLIPRYPTYEGGASPIDSSILDYREQLMDDFEKRRRETLTQEITQLHDAAQLDSRKYLDLFRACQMYEKSFPHDPSRPEPCAAIQRCAPHPDRVSDNDCRVDPARFPCVCGEDNPSLCMDEHTHCYRKGCVTERQQGECAI